MSTAKVNLNGHPWYGRTVVVVGDCPHKENHVVCELLEEQELHRDKRQICSLQPENLSFTDVEIERFAADSPAFARGLRMEKARIGSKAV